MSNPEPEPEPAAAVLDPNDPEVRALQGQPVPDPPARFRQPSVEDVPDEQDRIQPSLARTSTLDQSLHPSRDPSVPRPTIETSPGPRPTVDFENYYQNTAANGEVSPLGPPSVAAPPSVGGGYFPRMPDDPHTQPGAEAPLLPSAPGAIPGSPGDAPVDVSPIMPPTAPDFSSPSSPYSQSFPGQSHNLPSHAAPSPELGPQFHQAPTAPSAPFYGTHAPPSAPPPQHSYYSQPPQQPSAPPPIPQAAVELDEEAFTKAQKHARWAISALNFEDVPTAIKELREALETLGARGAW